MRPTSYLLYTLTTLMLLFSFTSAANAQSRGDYNREEHKTYPFTADGRISLENINGDVHITTWDRNEVKLDARITAYSQERLDEVDLDIDAGQSRLYIKTRYPDRDSDRWDYRGRSDRPARVDYTLSVPRSVTLDKIKLINGDLDLKDMTGEIQISTVNGRIRGENLQGRMRISTVNGDMELAIPRITRDNPVEINSVNGRIRVTLPSDTNARVKASTVHGRISNDFDLSVNRGRFVGNKLSGRIGDGSGRVDLSNVNGTITIRRAEDGRAKSPVENLLRESKSRSRWDDDDRGRDDDDNDDWDDDDDDDDWDDDDDDWSSRSRYLNQDEREDLSQALQNVQSFVMDIVGTTMEAIEIEDIKVDHRHEVIREKHEIQQEVQEGMREARREIQRAMREVRREIRDWDSEW